MKNLQYLVVAIFIIFMIFIGGGVYTLVSDMGDLIQAMDDRQQSREHEINQLRDDIRDETHEASQEAVERIERVIELIEQQDLE